MQGSKITSVLFVIVAVAFSGVARADSTWVYAVQLSATIQDSPAQITLHWEPDPYGATRYTVFRKFKQDTSWGTPIADLAGSATSYTDRSVALGVGYEYQVTKTAALGYKGYGYMYAGIGVGPTERRGTVILAVASNIVDPLRTELAQLESDLVGDGWRTIRHVIAMDAAPDYLRGLIRAEYLADPENVSTVFLLGHLPIRFSGHLNYDSHGFRAMAADGFYGDMDGTWATGTNGPSFFPSEIRLMVGRVDFFDMPGTGAATAWPSEIELLRRYLQKNHNWRFKTLTAPRRALMANRSGDIRGIAPAATGYRVFQPLVGPGNTIEADTADNAPASERWISRITSDAYLWTMACGGGGDTTISQMGTHGVYNDAWSTDIVGQGVRVIFALLNGSHFADWHRKDNLVRSVIAAPTYGLTACLAGGPHWYLHHMGLGETIGFSTRLTMNNSTQYQNQSNYLARAIYINLMGDPTLRMDVIAPPTNLRASAGGGIVGLAWIPSAEPVSGYRVYRSKSSAGPFERISELPASATTFSESPGPGTFSYLVRAITLQRGPSGSYYNLSQGISTTVVNSGSTPARIISARTVPGGLEITWDAVPGAVYHVEGRAHINQGNWIDLSGAVTAAGTVVRWTNSALPQQHQFYRIVSH